MPARLRALFELNIVHDKPAKLAVPMHSASDGVLIFNAAGTQTGRELIEIVALNQAELQLAAYAALSYPYCRVVWWHEGVIRIFILNQIFDPASKSGR